MCLVIGLANLLGLQVHHRVEFTDGRLGTGHIIDVPIYRLAMLHHRCLQGPVDDRTVAHNCGIQTLMRHHPLVPLTLIPALLQARLYVIRLLRHDILRIGHKQRVAERIGRITQGIEIALRLTHAIHITHKSRTRGFDIVIPQLAERNGRVSHRAVQLKVFEQRCIHRIAVQRDLALVR